MKILVCISVFTALSAHGQDDDRRNTRNKGADVSEKVIAAYEAGSFHGMPYRLLLPEAYDESIRYPLILSLHGRAGIGDDNRSQLRGWNAKFLDSAWRRKHPCIVIVPQSWDSWSFFNERVPDVTTDKTWESDTWDAFFQARGGYPSEQVSTGSLTLALLLVEEVSRRFSVDEDRVYVLGHSGGGFGSWNAIWHDPERFAAAIPTAGGLPPWKDPIRFKEVPVWAFHGDADPVVPVEFTREIFERMKEVGGDMKYTELSGVKHGANVPGFSYTGDDLEKGWKTEISSERCDASEDIWEWLFRQRR
ncbi:MAG: hypothetical protein AAGD22_17675 [Verrucomicrobiota bacterium]